jgi:glyoxylase-like metal-dependent hydrolase (beta-lactamase superfamily II)
MQLHRSPPSGFDMLAGCCRPLLAVHGAERITCDSFYDTVELGQIEGAGCEPGKLKLILLTYGDFDHTGNAKYLRERFTSKIAMHRDDLGMVERGDMFWNRGLGNVLVKALAPVLFQFRHSGRFSPDLFIEDGYVLAEYGASLKVVHLLGHARGSIGLLTDKGELLWRSAYQ